MRKWKLVIPMVLLAGACAPGEDDAAAPEQQDSETAAVAPAPAGDGEDGVRQFLAQTYPDALPLEYALAWADLDGDGADEAIVHVVAPYVCGSGGCNTLVLTPAGEGWRAVADISVSRTPVGMLDSATNGWRDLTVTVGGGGGPAGAMRLAFDGTAYPSNPTVEPAMPADEAGTILLPEEPEMGMLEAAG